MAGRFLNRLFRRSHQNPTPRRTPGLESLENRTLLSSSHVTVTSVTADNRGEVLVQLSGAINAADVNTSSIQMYNAGHDNKIGTADDVQVAIQVHYNTTNHRITIVGTVPANIAYRVKMVAARILDTVNAPLDGDFGGTFPSGNGKAGGNFEFQVKNDTSATPTAQFLTSEGTMDVGLFRGATKSTIATPKNVASFLSFANAGDYDNMFVARDAVGFVEQMGGLKINNNDQVVAIPDITSGSVPGEPGNSNTIGTVSFALFDDNNNNDNVASENSADNEFFFNLANNTGLDSHLNGGGPFTVFGKVTNSRSMAVLNAINGLDRLNLNQSAIGQLATDVGNVPVLPNVTVTGETSSLGGSTNQTINPIKNFVVIQRVALLMVVRPL
jgi:cyclophilin family peptidyl-prolyl cis-trans isomerase